MLRDIVVLVAYAAWLALAVHNLAAGLCMLAIVGVGAAPVFWARRKRRTKDEQPDAHAARQMAPRGAPGTDMPHDTAPAARPGYAAHQGSIRLAPLATTDTEGSPQ
jgi:hypothetical protein